jgi:hypothetical protein
VTVMPSLSAEVMTGPLHGDAPQNPFIVNRSRYPA